MYVAGIDQIPSVLFAFYCTYGFVIELAQDFAVLAGLAAYIHIAVDFCNTEACIIVFYHFIEHFRHLVIRCVCFLH